MGRPQGLGCGEDDLAAAPGVNGPLACSGERAGVARRKPTPAARSHTKPGFMDERRQLGQLRVPLFCRHLGRQRALSTPLRPVLPSGPWALSSFLACPLQGLGCILVAVQQQWKGRERSPQAPTAPGLPLSSSAPGTSRAEQGLGVERMGWNQTQGRSGPGCLT